jgi:hypothetical protein
MVHRALNKKFKIKLGIGLSFFKDELHLAKAFSHDSGLSR